MKYVNVDRYTYSKRVCECMPRGSEQPSMYFDLTYPTNPFDIMFICKLISPGELDPARELSVCKIRHKSQSLEVSISIMCFIDLWFLTLHTSFRTYNANFYYTFWNVACIIFPRNSKWLISSAQMYLINFCQSPNGKVEIVNISVRTWHTITTLKITAR